MSKKYPNIVYNDLKIGKALSRFLRFCFGFEKIILNPLKDPYKFRAALEMAEKSDFLIVDSFINGKPMGFRFAKQMTKRTLMLFYSGELNIENEGSFWLKFPVALDKFGGKIVEMLSQSKTEVKEYEKLEERFPALRESTRHHL